MVIPIVWSSFRHFNHSDTISMEIIQAYTVELEAELKQLKEENGRLKEEEVKSISNSLCTYSRYQGVKMALLWHPLVMKCYYFCSRLTEENAGIEEAIGM